jgi:competence protein ComEA
VNSLDFDRRTVLLLAAVFLGAIGLTLFFTRSSQPTPVVAPVVVASSSPAATSAAPTASASPAGEIMVEVVGKVRDPQVVSLPAGARVLDAVEAAGGVRPGVDTTDQNLARILVDGEQIRIGLPAAPATRAPVPGTTAGSSPVAGLIDINTAPAEVLEQIPGVGPVIAQRIVAYRDQNGGFRTVEQLTEVSGIGEATFAQMQPMVTVGAGG